jgi:hypothetical protein
LLTREWKATGQPVFRVVEGSFIHPRFVVEHGGAELLCPDLLAYCDHCVLGRPPHLRALIGAVVFRALRKMTYRDTEGRAPQ